jgi:hypothetical protein
VNPAEDQPESSPSIFERKKKMEGRGYTKYEHPKQEFFIALAASMFRYRAPCLFDDQLKCSQKA